MSEYKKSRLVIRPIALFIFSVLYLVSCTSGQKKFKEEKKEHSTQSFENDSSSLFDGETLNGWEITNFGPQGSVYVSSGEIILGMGDGNTGITLRKKFPVMDYEVTLDARRVEGNDFFCGMTFPVGKESCTLIIGGWGGTTVGLSSINGKDAAENETTRLLKFEKNRWYNIRLEVLENVIRAWIDNTMVVDFKKGDKILSIRAEVELSKPFGIASWNTTSAVKNIRVRKIEE